MRDGRARIGGAGSPAEGTAGEKDLERDGRATTGGAKTWCNAGGEIAWRTREGRDTTGGASLGSTLRALTEGPTPPGWRDNKGGAGTGTVAAGGAKVRSFIGAASLVGRLLPYVSGTVMAV